MCLFLPGRLIGAMRLVGVDGGNTKVPGIPGEGSATEMILISVTAQLYTASMHSKYLQWYGQMGSSLKACSSNAYNDCK